MNRKREGRGRKRPKVHGHPAEEGRRNPASTRPTVVQLIKDAGLIHPSDRVPPGLVKWVVFYLEQLGHDIRRRKGTPVVLHKEADAVELTLRLVRYLMTCTMQLAGGLCPPPTPAVVRRNPWLGVTKNGAYCVADPDEEPVEDDESESDEDEEGLDEEAEEWA